MGLKVSVEFWTEHLTGSLPETARRVPPRFDNEETVATRPPSEDAERGAAPESLRVRVVGTFRVMGRFWSVPGEELTVNVRPVGDGGDSVQPVERTREGTAPWIRRD